MKVELTRKLIITLLRGVEPCSYEVMGIIPDEIGEYHGGFSDRWEWNIRSDKYWDTKEDQEKYPDEYLYNLYLKCIGDLPITDEDKRLKKEYDKAPKSDNDVYDYDKLAGFISKSIAEEVCLK